MSLGTMNIPGIASGLDTSGIIEKLMNLEKQPYNRLLDEQHKLELKKEMVQDVNSRAFELQTMAFDLTLEKSFATQKVSSSDEDVATASLSGYQGSSSGYNITVTALAASHSVASDRQSVPDKDTGLGHFGGKFTINGVEFTIDDNFSLNTIKNMINSNTSAGAKASIIDNRLILESSKTGSGNDLSISDTLDHVMENLGVIDASGAVKNEIRPSSDATVSIDGISVTSSTNTLTDVIDGLTLNITAAGSTRISFSRDVSGTVEKVKTFVEKYNEMLNFLADRIEEDPLKSTIIAQAEDQETKDELLKIGLLSSDFTMVTLQTSLRSSFSAIVGDLSMQDVGLGSAGMSGGVLSDEAKRGIIELDEEKLTAALQSDPDKVISLFRNSGSVSSVKSESIGKGTGVETVFHTDYENIGQSFSLSVDGVSYKEAKEFSIDPLIRATQFLLDRNSGTITFGEAPAANAAIAADYNHYEGSQFSTDGEKSIHSGTGVTKEFFIGASRINDGASVKVGGVLYEEVAYKSDLSAANQYYLDRDTGKITFFEAPANQAEISVSFSHFVTDQGIMWRLNNTLKEYSGIGVFYSQESGINEELRDIQDRLSSMETRLSNKESTLWNQYTILETTLGKLQNQSSWLTSQLAKLS